MTRGMRRARGSRQRALESHQEGGVENPLHGGPLGTFRPQKPILLAPNFRKLCTKIFKLHLYGGFKLQRAWDARSHTARKAQAVRAFSGAAFSAPSSPSEEES